MTKLPALSVECLSRLQRGPPVTPRRITKSLSDATFARRPDEAWEPYSEAARENGQIELCLEATQAALSAAESETSAVWGIHLVSAILQSI